MGKPERRRVAACVIPLLFGLMTAARASERVRAVDFLALFGAGTLFGIGVSGLIRLWRSRATANRAGF
ncbi:MAG TPA: hypothetical protein VFW45_11405 [Candidatus Polarisedimenticolia bacterium]|nr:hypothetical protein [Candidatus Polarisedimenticolia bacterium]